MTTTRIPAALLAGAALVLTGCGPAADAPSAGPSTTQSTSAAGPSTTQSSSINPNSVTVWEVGGWRETDFRSQTTGSGTSTSTTLLMDVTNLQQTTRTGEFVITLGRAATGADVTNTQAKAVNVAPGQTVTVSGPASRALSPSLDVGGSDFVWEVQTIQG